MTEVEYGGRGAPHTAKRSKGSIVVSMGCPPPPYINGVEGEGRPRGGGAPKGGIPSPSRSRIPLFLVELGALPSSRSRREGKGKGKIRKEGAQPLPLVQFGLGLGGRIASPLSFP